MLGEHQNPRSRANAVDIAQHGTHEPDVLGAGLSGGQHDIGDVSSPGDDLAEPIVGHPTVHWPGARCLPVRGSVSTEGDRRIDPIRSVQQFPTQRAGEEFCVRRRRLEVFAPVVGITVSIERLCTDT